MCDTLTTQLRFARNKKLAKYCLLQGEHEMFSSTQHGATTWEQLVVKSLQAADLDGH